MARNRKDFRARKNVRVELHQPGFLIPAPDAPWIECLIVDVSDTGACLDVGALAVPELFGLAFTAGGEVLRICSLVWRRGELVGARFVTAKELRQGVVPTDAASKLLNAPAD
jgi:PilZ domain